MTIAEDFGLVIRTWRSLCGVLRRDNFSDALILVAFTDILGLNWRRIRWCCITGINAFLTVLILFSRDT